MSRTPHLDVRYTGCSLEFFGWPRRSHGPIRLLVTCALSAMASGVLICVGLALALPCTGNLADYQDMWAWLHASGGDVSALTPVQRQGLVEVATAHDVHEGEPLATIPLHLTLGAFALMNTSFQHLLLAAKWQYTEGDDLPFAALAILHHFHAGAKSPLYAYVRTLPRPLNMTLVAFQYEQLGALERSEYLQAKAALLQEALLVEFESMRNNVLEYCPLQSSEEACPPSWLTFDEWTWAAALLHTRGWLLHVPTPAALCGGAWPRYTSLRTLVPVMDLVNHHPSCSAGPINKFTRELGPLTQVATETRAFPQHFLVRSWRFRRHGEVVWECYGDHNNVEVSTWIVLRPEARQLFESFGFTTGRCSSRDIAVVQLPWRANEWSASHSCVLDPDGEARYSVPMHGAVIGTPLEELFLDAPEEEEGEDMADEHPQVALTRRVLSWVEALLLHHCPNVEVGDEEEWHVDGLVQHDHPEATNSTRVAAVFGRDGAAEHWRRVLDCGCQALRNAVLRTRHEAREIRLATEDVEEEVEAVRLCPSGIGLASDDGIGADAEGEAQLEL